MDSLCGPSCCRKKAFGYSDRGSFGITCIRIKMVFHCFCSFSPISMPLSLALPMVPFLLQCHFYHVTNFPRICKSHSTKNIKPKLSVVSMLAYQWPLQNLSVPISVMNKMAKLRPCCPCTPVLCVRLIRALKCHPTSSPLLLPKYLTSYIYGNHRAPLLSSFTAVVVLRVALQQQHLLSICGNADSGAHS